MRAIFYSFDESLAESTLEIQGDSFHHLMVTRVRQGEKVLILNGKGVRLFGEMAMIGKKSAVIKVLEKDFVPEGHQIDIAVGLPKKEAFEDILKMATELGVRNIYPIKTEYSQFEYQPNERYQRILESALIQSNNAYFPDVHPQITLSDFLLDQNFQIVFFNSEPQTRNESIDLPGRKIILIGPEGGFSDNEVDLIRSYVPTLEVHLPTPILRAPTAVAASVGYLLSLSNSKN